MFKSLATTFIIVTFASASCVQIKSIFIKDIFVDFKGLKINTAVDFETKNKSKDFTPTHLISIGEGIYPNKNNYKLETPRIFIRPDKPNFQLETEYYYVLNDSSVKVILYQWDILEKKEKELSVQDKNAETKRTLFTLFQLKFDQLTDSLTKVLGLPKEKNIEQNRIAPDQPFRDDIKWEGLTGCNAYLFMFGNNESGFRQIRLAV